MTHLWQPLDLSVNGWVKRRMRKRFGDMYAEQIRSGLDNSLQLESIEVKMTLTLMKPLHARWLIELYNTMITDQGKEAIISGWKEAGVSDAIEITLPKLSSLDPFNDILPNEECADFEMRKMYPG